MMFNFLRKVFFMGDEYELRAGAAEGVPGAAEGINYGAGKGASGVPGAAEGINYGAGKGASGVGSESESTPAPEAVEPQALPVVDGSNARPEYRDGGES